MERSGEAHQSSAAGHPPAPGLRCHDRFAMGCRGFEKATAISSEGVPERWSADVRRPSSACGPARATGIRNAEHKRHANGASISWVRNSGWAGRSPQGFAPGTRITARVILAKRQGHRYRHAEQPNGTIEDYRTRIAWRAAISTTCAWNRKDGMPARSSPFS